MKAQELKTALEIVEIKLGPAERRGAIDGSMTDRMFQRVRIVVRNPTTELTLFVVGTHPDVDFDPEESRAELSFVPKTAVRIHSREPINTAIGPGEKTEICGDVPHTVHVFEYGKKAV